MVNPSTADASKNDQTIRKLMGFGKRFRWREITVVNKFAYRATDVNNLRIAVDPIGPSNDAHILEAMFKSDIIIVAWGSLAKLPPELRDRWRSIVGVATTLNKALYCLGTCDDGHPKHPVMIGYSNIVRLWEPPK